MTPNAPLRRADIVAPPPWHIAGDVIALEFWADLNAVAATLPPGLTLDVQSNGRVVAIFADCQFTAEDEELLDPARYQCREFFTLVDSIWNETPVHWIPYSFADNDAALARGWIKGSAKRLGSIFQTRTFPVPGPAAAAIAQGAKFGASLSVHGQRLANAGLTLRRDNADASAILARPVVHRRHFPDIRADRRDRPTIDELVRVGYDDLTIVDAWSGEAELKFPEALGEELHALSPIKMGVGYRFSMSFSIGNFVVLQDFAK
jgi:acetoacetate decarboxylase